MVVDKPVDFSTLRQSLGARLQGHNRLWCRLPDHTWSEVTNDASLPWNVQHAASSPYTILVREDTPPASPEKGKGDSRPDVLRGPALLDHDHAHADPEADLVAGFCGGRPVLSVSDSPTAEALGLTFPLVGWEDQAVLIAKDVASNWRQWLSPLPSVRNVTSFAAQGASGTGKTRLGRELAGLILPELRKLSEPLELIDAVEQCVQRGLTLCFDFKQYARNRKPDDIRAADLLWEAYTIARLLPTLPVTWRQWQPPSLDHVFEAISRIERKHSPFAAAIAIVVHLDECQELTPERLGELIYRALAPFYSSGRPRHQIFSVRARVALRLANLSGAALDRLCLGHQQAAGGAAGLGHHPQVPHAAVLHQRALRGHVPTRL